MPGEPAPAIPLGSDERREVEAHLVVKLPAAATKRRAEYVVPVLVPVGVLRRLGLPVD